MTAASPPSDTTVEGRGREDTAQVSRSGSPRRGDTAHGDAAVALVRCLARLEPTPAQVATAAALAADVDPAAVLTAAAALGVGPLVCTHVDAEAFPAALRTRAAGYRREIAVRNLHLVTSLHTVLDAFDAAGVRALAYKGPVLAVRAYGNVGGRAFSDLDLFVSPADLAAATTALTDLGFTLDPADPTRFSPADVARGGHVVRPPSEFRFCRADGLAVEVRWRLGSRIRPFPLSFEACWARRVDLAVGGRPVSTFAPEDLLLVLARHGAKHHWNRLGWVVDVAALLTRVDLDWSVVEERAAAVGARRVLAACLLLAGDVADAPVPPLVLSAARADPRVRTVVDDATTAYDTEPLTAAFGVEGARERAVDRLLCDSHRERLLLRLRLGFQPQEVDVAAVPLPRPLHRLYHVVRPLRLARDALGGGTGAREPSRGPDRSERR